MDHHLGECGAADSRGGSAACWCWNTTAREFLDHLGPGFEGLDAGQFYRLLRARHAVEQ